MSGQDIGRPKVGRPAPGSAPSRAPFLLGVFFITQAVLVFQVVQTRILSVIAWYHLAFFAISVAMLGMTAGAVWIYLKRDSLRSERLSTYLADSALLTAVAVPASIVLQFCLVTSMRPSVTSVAAWAVLMTAMTVPYVFAGITVSLALTRSPFPVSQVYGVDLVGAALGCVLVLWLLDVFDGPSAILCGGVLAAVAAWCFARAATAAERDVLAQRRWWLKPPIVVAGLAAIVLLNSWSPFGLKPLLVKDDLEAGWSTRYEKWNSYSRIVALPPAWQEARLWGPSPKFDSSRRVNTVRLNIDGLAGTSMYAYDGTSASIEFLEYDLVNLAYHLRGISSAAVIGVGGGRDLLAGHFFGVGNLTGIELNSTFVDLHTRHPFYRDFSGLTKLPHLALHVDDARSWFAATDERFDLIQMSMIDTWAATGAGAYSLSENGLYTLQGWRTFMRRLEPGGLFTVSRWYSPGDVNETGRMIALGLGTLLDAGAADPRRHVFVATVGPIATLVLRESPFTAEQLTVLRETCQRLGFAVLVDPDGEPASNVLRSILHARSLTELDRVAATPALDLTVPTDNRPFFFNQLRFRHIPRVIGDYLRGSQPRGVLTGNLVATITLVLILGIALVAVVATILVPLRRAATSASRPLIRHGTLYFSLIGFGFMFAEISLLQYFSLFLGHPIYALGVCLFSLILSSGIGSLVSGRLPLSNGRRVLIWGVLLGGYLLIAQWGLARLFEATASNPLSVRIAVSLVVIVPAGFLMGFAFPTGMTLVERIDREPTPWFWGINGATGVLASVLAIMIGMAFGINVTMIAAALCYLALIPIARALQALPRSA